jgi:hypothetical protein
MVRLMVEEVLQHAAEMLAEWFAFHVAVFEYAGEIGFRQLRDPCADNGVQLFTVGAQRGQRAAEGVREAGGLRQRRGVLQRRVAGRMRAESLEPDGVARQQVVDGAEQGAEEGLAVGLSSPGGSLAAASYSFWFMSAL